MNQDNKTVDVYLWCFTKLFTCLYCIHNETKTLLMNETKSAGSFHLYSFIFGLQIGNQICKDLISSSCLYVMSSIRQHYFHGLCWRLSPVAGHSHSSLLSGLAQRAFDQSHLFAHYRCMNAAVSCLTHARYSCIAKHARLTHRPGKTTGSSQPFDSVFWFCCMAWQPCLEI